MIVHLGPAAAIAAKDSVTVVFAVSAVLAIVSSLRGLGLQKMENEAEGAMAKDKRMTPQRFCNEATPRKSQREPVNGLD